MKEPATLRARFDPTLSDGSHPNFHTNGHLHCSANELQSGDDSPAPSWSQSKSLMEENRKTFQGVWRVLQVSHQFTSVGRCPPGIRHLGRKAADKLYAR